MEPNQEPEDFLCLECVQRMIDQGHFINTLEDIIRRYKPCVSGEHQFHLMRDLELLYARMVNYVADVSPRLLTDEQLKRDANP